MSHSGTHVAARMAPDVGSRNETSIEAPASEASDIDGPAIEVGDNELLDDDGDDEPHSRQRPSVTGLLPARAKTALATASESDRVLRDLLRTAQFLSAAVQGACDRSSENVRELESLDGALQSQADDYRRLHQRIQELELELRDAKEAAARERQFLSAQQDAFISELITEREELEKTLSERLAEQERINRELTERLASGDTRHVEDDTG